ncbi:sporulation integral membrane protein YtvI [Clostridium sp. BNL1100]|uniref:sporulation integral membrane protein YtvI n=1 Tax=Clostridium sp. BNL1100 TaxID=755731 RepID=UPI00024A7EAA|nr:sporulation integral membrane protein YtvI [Clostridium sp. BNL1100]AEY68073.1 sporulation integral membrane protein YtvI [Clostridium sp. BNL1100]
MELWNKYQSTIKKFFLILLIFAVIYLSISYLLPFFAPFVIALIVSYINEPVIKLLQRFNISRKAAAAISLLFTMSVLGFGLTVGIIKIYNELIVLQDNLTAYSSDISVKINGLIDKATIFYNGLPDQVTSTITKNLVSFSEKIGFMITSVIQYVINTVSSIPRLTVFVIVTILGTYFISSDRKSISSFFYRQLPFSWRKNIASLKKDTFKALLGYFKAILILMGFTFIEVSVGLFILNVKYAFLIALVVGLSDAIPIMGTGVVMVPWILWTVISGDMPLALGLSIIYVLGILIRQIMEPKIVGSQIGLHPLVTLLAMYIGLKFFGIIGMFVGPISIIVVKKLQDSGAMRLWND